MKARRCSLRTRLPLPVLLILFAVGCADPVEPEPQPIGLDVQGPTQRLAMGTTARLAASVRSSGGSAASGIPVRWVSRDSTTVTVDSTGTVTAVLAGEAWVVATAGAFSDSALVEVAFSPVPGEGRMRLRTDRTDRVVVLPSPTGIWFDYLSRTEEDFSWLEADNHSSTDTVLVLLLPAAPLTGWHLLTDWHPSLLDTMDIEALSRPLALLLIEEPYPYIQVVPLRGWAELEIVDAPPGPGSRLGALRARLVVKGEAFRGDEGAEAVAWSPLSRPYELVADLQPAYQHWAVGTSAGQVTGTGKPVTWQTREAWWGPSWKAPAYRLSVEDGPPDLSVDMNGVGSVPIGSVLRLDQAVLQVVDWEAGYFGTASEGRVEVTRYVPPPAPDLFGEIQGRVQARGSGSTDRGAPFTFETSFDFDAPVMPAQPSSNAPRAPQIGSAGLRWVPGLAALMSKPVR